MRATEGIHRATAWQKLIALMATGMLASSIAAGAVQAANSRIYTVTLSTPTPVSQGGATKFDITVQSGDNQTIANVILRVPATGQSWPDSGITISQVFGLDAAMCQPPGATSLVCDFGNIAAFGSRHISILANVATSVPVGNTLTFSASAETNNENGSNLQVVSGTSPALQVLAFDANSLTTFNLGGTASTAPLDSFGAGNLQTSLNLLQNNQGNGNAIGIIEGTTSTQPAYCVTLKLTCQPDFTVVTVNGGDAVSPYLETILTANVPKTYNIKKAFVIHVLADGTTMDQGFPLYNVSATSCVAHPALLPCADFSLSKTSVLTIVVHTATNGKFNY